MSSKTLSFKAASIKILKEHGAPLHSKEITARALAQDLLNTTGKTPDETLNARIAVSIKNEGDRSPFVRTAPSTFGLRSWLKAGEIAPYNPDEDDVQVKVPDFPTYTSLRALLPLWEGVDRSLVTSLHGSLSQMTGTRSESLDWTDPEAWIPQRLDGRSQELALTTWRKNKGSCEPSLPARPLALGIWLWPHLGRGRWPPLPHSRRAGRHQQPRGADNSGP